jgi:preprotein translocase subunit SecG
MLLSLAASGWLIGILTVLFMVVCVVLILTVLIQRPQGGGLAGAFGSGAGSGQTAFGTKTGDALTIFTIIVFVVFIGAAIGLNYAAQPEEAPKATPTSSEKGPTESKPSDAKPSDAKPADTKSSDTGAPATQPSPTPNPPAADTEPTPADAPSDKPAEKPAEPQPAEPKPADPPKQS